MGVGEHRDCASYCRCHRTDQKQPKVLPHLYSREPQRRRGADGGSNRDSDYFEEGIKPYMYLDLHFLYSFCGVQPRGRGQPQFINTVQETKNIKSERGGESGVEWGGE